jgi:predicted nucleotidyltransferase
VTKVHQDFKDLLSGFANEKVSYLLIGGYAVSYYGRPRFTKDLDIWIANESANLEKVYFALAKFGAPRHILDDLAGLAPDEILFMGNPPVRIDFLQQVKGLEYETAYGRRNVVQWQEVPVSLVSLEDLITSKRAAGRPQDLVDAQMLENLDLADEF